MGALLAWAMPGCGPCRLRCNCSVVLKSRTSGDIAGTSCPVRPAPSPCRAHLSTSMPPTLRASDIRAARLMMLPAPDYRRKYLPGFFLSSARPPQHRFRHRVIDYQHQRLTQIREIRRGKSLDRVVESASRTPRLMREWRWREQEGVAVGLGVLTSTAPIEPAAPSFVSTSQVWPEARRHLFRRPGGR